MAAIAASCGRGGPADGCCAARGNLDKLGILRGELAGWRDGIAAAELHAAKIGRTRLQVAQATDCADWLPNDLLTKLDRCLMAHGVEGRTPFLDPVVAAFAFRLPDELKVRNGMGKWLLRRWLAEHVPAAEPFARKRGFTVPVGDWIARRGAQLGPLVAASRACARSACRARSRRCSASRSAGTRLRRLDAAVLRALAPLPHRAPAARARRLRHARHART